MFYHYWQERNRNAQWRGLLYIELEAWYKDFQPTKRRKSSSKAMKVVDVDVVHRFRGIDNFVDPFADAGAPGAGVCAAAAIRAPASARPGQRLCRAPASARQRAIRTAAPASQRQLPRRRPRAGRRPGPVGPAGGGGPPGGVNREK